MKKQSKSTGIHRLFVRVRDKTQQIRVDPTTNIQYVPTIWKEVSEVNLGSKKVPNKDILEIRWVWEEFEEDGSRKKFSHDEFFKRFFGD